MRLTLLIIGLWTLNVLGQSGFQLGIEASPVYHADIQRNKVTTIRTTASGYGFNVGVPIKWWMSDYVALQSGLTFDLMMFDNRAGKVLQSSTRHGSIHLPLMLDYALTDSWHALFGAGLNYNFMNVQWTPQGKLSLDSQTNRFQPYIGVGLSTLMDRDAGVFELGAQARYHFIDMYKDGWFSDEDFTDRIISFDVILRYYLVNR